MRYLPFFILLNVELLFLNFDGLAQKDNSYVINSCVLSKEIMIRSKRINSIELASAIKLSPDSCNLNICDSLLSKISNSNRRVDFDNLETFSSVIDGYLSEYFVEKLGKAYTINFKTLFDFLYVDYVNGKKNNLQNYLIESWSLEASELKDYQKGKELIKNKVYGLLPDLKKHSSEYKYLEIQLSKINPTLYD